MYVSIFQRRNAEMVWSTLTKLAPVNHRVPIGIQCVEVNMSKDVCANLVLFSVVTNASELHHVVVDIKECT